MPINQNITIIVAEDDDGHFLLTQHCLRQHGINNQIIRLRDGQAVLEFLFQNHHNNSPQASCLLILDIRMPKVDGIEVLAELKNNPQTAKIPIIVLSTSDAPRHVEACRQYGCDAYSTKPVGESFIQTVHQVCRQHCPA
ncbi:MAG: response regulator [Sedimentisphaerales bacterium]|nr:response regulator [Sedimentisphaerales bacterium]